SNLSMLDDGQIERLIKSDSISLIIVNFPSSDAARFRQVTRSRRYDVVVRNIALLREGGINVGLSVNAPTEDANETLGAINETFVVLLGTQRKWDTDDRAVSIDSGEYRLPTLHQGRLSGCELALWQVNVSYEGKVFLCCQDYDQDYVVGDILLSPLKDIVEGPRMIELRV